MYILASDMFEKDNNYARFFNGFIQKLQDELS